MLIVTYPPPQHTTTSDRIFVLGTAPKGGNVFVNGKPIRRSEFGHFAPSFPLRLGRNELTVTYGQQRKILRIDRLPAVPVPPAFGFVPDSLFPRQKVVLPPGELVCFQAIATPNSTVTVARENWQMSLVSVPQLVLPPNHAVLTHTAQTHSRQPGLYQGCTRQAISGKYVYKLTQGDRSITAPAPGELVIRETFPTVLVTTDQAVTRSGPGTDYSRLTPLPQGTQAMVTGQIGNWLRLEYGAWIEQKDTKTIERATPVRSIIRGVSSRPGMAATEILFPLEVPVPISIRQEAQKLVLTLHYVTAQTDTVFLSPNPVIERLDFQQVSPDRVEYTLTFKTKQQWGYSTRYEGNTLVLTVRHPSPQVRVLIDPGHGSSNDLGARGPNGYPEKDVTLKVAQLLARALQTKGIEVILTRSGDEDLLPQQRAEIINRVKPTLALSLHYNALPDNGDAETTQGIGTFWYHPHSHHLAQFLHDYLTGKLNRQSYGVFWGNLALTRPTIAPSVLLELGFMTHPQEFAWITDPQAQQQLADVLAEGIVRWLTDRKS
ncbi:MAG: N-acetylmuramoyl-L-alanine amidase [Pseudanabaenaceae cyanobacterium SKYGB_i_bin29]|nr:N-acetylmuramoyl-L-alanine amidase [Pseudanabaenaceae cyanobacterium SKYG29]MDW8420957.1 N-acetylmuramoyl-L-alanine amidase [Pseudanabaenaceae cyanobacterium SKYGB_i_bin29]